MQTAGIVGLGCLAVIGILALGIAIWTAIWTVLVMLVWNFLLVPAFHLGAIDWLQGIAIAVVLTLLSNAVRSTSGSNS